MRPKTIRIGPHEYEVRSDPGLGEKAGAMGASSEDNAAIVLDTNVAKTMQRETLVHEILHCMWKQTSLRIRWPDSDPNSPGEGIIQDLAPLLYGFIRDNREVVEWLSR
jgi:hypothetical protein